MASSDADLAGEASSSSSARSAPLLADPPPPPSSAATTTRRRLPPPCWTDDEADALIDAYRDKWYALLRGNLRAPHWQEVADDVARRCFRLPGATHKTALQCRHKIEKLRKRYRAERRRSLSSDPSAPPPSSSWILFRKIDAMERGAGGRSAVPGAARSEDDDEDDDEFAALNGGGGMERPRLKISKAVKSRVVGSMAEEDDDDEFAARNGGDHFAAAAGRRVGGGGLEGARLKIPKAVKSRVVGSMAEERAVTVPATFPNLAGCSFGAGVGPGRRRDGEDGGAVEEMVSSLRMLGERFLRMEQMKMEQAREMERARMEGELKRTEVIIDSHCRIVDAFVKGLAGKKRARASQGS